MSNNKKQALTAVGTGLILLGIFFLVFALSMPKQLVAVEGEGDKLTAVMQDNSEGFSENLSEPEGITVTYPLNLNTCTYQELMSVKGVGESRARLILEYRDYLGGYTSVEQLKDISGIGDEIYNEISVYFTV